MGFVNERIEKENRRTFFNSYGNKLIPSKWTIDKEKDYILFIEGQDREPPHNYSFVFYYMNNIIQLTLSCIREFKHCTWKLEYISFPKDFDYEKNKEDIMRELEKAFKVFGCNGSPIMDYSDWKFEFDRGNY